MVQNYKCNFPWLFFQTFNFFSKIIFKKKYGYKQKLLLPGDSEIDQLFRIFRTLGTADEVSWPGVSKLPDFKSQFPRWEPQSLSSLLPINLSDQGKDLFKKLVVYNPAKRISAREAFNHPYFADMNWEGEKSA